MKLLDFGSMNIDYVYQLPHQVREGETLSSTGYARNEGGKGLNQAIALARAGREVYFSGVIGEDGLFLRNYLSAMGVDTRDVYVVAETTGHAIIQVSAEGGNSIILYGGANQCNTTEMTERTLSHFGAGDYILLQNELNNSEEIIRLAAARGMHVILNPSPVSENMSDWPLEMVDWLILNEVEGADISGESEPEKMLDVLLSRYPACHIVLTLGEAGSVYADREKRVFQPAVAARAVDTTAAGDTFTGYFIHAILSGRTEAEALNLAARASALAVSRAGAGKSIPFMAELEGATE